MRSLEGASGPRRLHQGSTSEDDGNDEQDERPKGEQSSTGSDEQMVYK